MDRQSATPDYTMGFSGKAMASPMRHTAENCAEYMLPYLRPGLRVLDFGCGPGTISVGIARRIDPGELHGIDMEESQIEMARSVAKESGQDNAVFHLCDATDLPFEDGFFDIAHGHNILMHVPDTKTLLAEIKRVLKPGGVICCREMITASSFAYPDKDAAKRLWDMLQDVVAANDGHPQMGKDMKGHILEAGFTNIQMSASFNTYDSPEEIHFMRYGAVEWLLSPEITDMAIKYGAWTDELSDQMRARADEWMEHPGAFGATAYGEVIANKP